MVYDFGQDDRALAMARDAAGNTYVTGQRDGNATSVVNWDYETVAYNHAGVQLWHQRFNGASSQNDFPSSIATDGTSVFVTGTIDPDPSIIVLEDAATRIYAATTGVLSGLAIFAAGAGLNDEARAVIAVTGGCVVAGNSQLTIAQKNVIATKYSTAGAQLWQNSVTGIGDNNENVRSLRIDGSNNVYAAGYSVETNRTGTWR
jgi:hypothetical protein